tara:strand:+ start:3077 stop:3847 length:771 start_codon:yes stop_codon:yes gene_type:complete
MLRLVKSIFYYAKNFKDYYPVEKKLDKIKKLEKYNFERHKTNDNNNLLNNLFDKGYCQEVSFFSEELMKDIISLMPKDIISKPGFNTFQIEKQIKDKIVAEIDSKIGKDLTKYLDDEPFYYRIELKKTVSDKNAPTVSSYWHYDLIGKRLKLFYFLDSSLSKITTHLIENSHIAKKSSNYIFSRLNSYLMFIKNIFTNKIKIISPIKGTFFIFDTNLFHKGGLVNSNKSFRWTLQCDIISRKKYDLISKYGDKIGL